MGTPILYSYYRSSCSWRVRTALNIKGIEYETRSVDLLKYEQYLDDFKKINPLCQVPTLIIDGVTLTQSLSILEYLNETRPENPLFPNDVKLRAIARTISECVNAGIQPLMNLPVLHRIAEDKQVWAREVISKGFEALETILKYSSGKFCVGDEVTMADCCLIPQVHNAERFETDMEPFPIIRRINEEALKLDVFIKSHPFNQPDCPPEMQGFP